MCKIDDFIDVTSRYIAELLDLRADIRPVEKDVLHTFPANITAGYTFCTANLLGHDVVLLYSADGCRSAGCTITCGTWIPTTGL